MKACPFGWPEHPATSCCLGCGSAQCPECADGLCPVCRRMRKMDARWFAEAIAIKQYSPVLVLSEGPPTECLTIPVRSR